MMKYKTIALASCKVEDAKAAVFGQLSVESANKGLSTVAQTIQAEAAGGWTFEQLYTVPVLAWRKVGCLERLLGKGKALVSAGSTFSVPFIVFSREA